MGRPVDQQGAESGHERGAVRQRQAFLGTQGYGPEAGLPQRGCAVEPTGPVHGFAFADEHQGHVRQGRQVPACAERTSSGNAGMHARVQHVRHQLYDFSANPRIAHGERICPDDQHGPHGLLVQFRSGSRRVTPDQVQLQFGDLVRRDQLVLEPTEPRGDAVGDPSFRDQPVHDLPGPFHAGKGIWVYGDGSAPRDGDHVVYGEIVAGEGQGVRVGLGIREGLGGPGISHIRPSLPMFSPSWGS